MSEILYQSNRIRKMTYIGIMSVLIIICSWINIPGAIPFSLQTFAIYFGLWLLGGKLTTYSLLVYLLMGIIGLPVFAGFRGGVGVLMGPTGGYICGFIVMTGLIWGYERVKRNVSDKEKVFLIILGTIICYAIGTVWYFVVMRTPVERESIISVLMICVVPYLIPDAAKMIFAKIIGKRVYKAISR